jgi:FkbM family methyltransferase
MGLLSKILRWLGGSSAPQDDPLPEAEEESVEGADSAEDETASEVVIYDENLYERARTQWQFGDWESLAQIEHESLLHHPQRAKLALLVASGHQQRGDTDATREFTRLAREWGASKKLVSQVLIAGVYNTLGKASALCGQQQRALEHFEQSLRTAGDGGDVRLLAEARIQQLKIQNQQNALLLPSSASGINHFTHPGPSFFSPPEGIVSYAQNYEDVMLWRALWWVKGGFYIDVGAWDPVVDSVSKAFYEHGWRGIDVEPLPEYAEALRNDRPENIVIKAIVSSLPGKKQFYHIRDTGLSTCIDHYADKYREDGWRIEEIDVSCITLAEIFDKTDACEIHWLKIDAEGMESDVIESWGEHCARPWILIIEATKPCSQILSTTEWEKMIHARGYQFIYFDGLNRFYVHNSHAELAQCFTTPPNVFDGFVRKMDNR